MKSIKLAINHLNPCLVDFLANSLNLHWKEVLFSEVLLWSCASRGKEDFALFYISKKTTIKDHEKMFPYSFNLEFSEAYK